MRLHAGYYDYRCAGAQLGSGVLVIRDPAVESLAWGRMALCESVLNLHFVMSVAGGLAARSVPLYYVQDVRAWAVLPSHGVQQGLYCVASLQQHHRLAVALFQRDYATCAVTDLQRPYRVALPLYVGSCTVVSEQAVMAAFVRAYATLRLVAVQRVMARVLLAYYAYLDR